jgi:uncharacterized protein HemY
VAAQPIYEESLAAAREHKVTPAIARLLMGLGAIAQHRREYVQARSLFEQSLALFRESHQTIGVAETLSHQARLARCAGEYEQASKLYRESVQMFQTRGTRRLLAMTLGGLAGVATAQQQPIRAARLFGASEALLQAIGAMADVSSGMQIAEDITATRSQLDPADWDRTWGEGQALTADQAVAYAVEGEPPLQQADR